jgi:hypothetical protein
MRPATSRATALSLWVAASVIVPPSRSSVLWTTRPTTAEYCSGRGARSPPASAAMSGRDESGIGVSATARRTDSVFINRNTNAGVGSIPPPPRLIPAAPNTPPSVGPRDEVTVTRAMRAVYVRGFGSTTAAATAAPRTPAAASHFQDSSRVASSPSTVTDASPGSAAPGPS